MSVLSEMSGSRREVVIFSDLDDSLFQSRRKCVGHEGELSVAAYDRTGNPRSFHTPLQRALLKSWEGATVIPVTGRSSDALARVTSLSWSSYRVVSHGAEVLGPDGQPLESWRQLISDEVTAWSARLMEVSAQVTRYIERLNATEREVPRVRVVYEADTPVYLSIKGPAHDLTELRERLTPQWSDGIIHHNDRDMALLPSYASKARAVSHLIEQLRAHQELRPLIIGLGDSVSDLPFLKLCDFALTPQDSHIQRELW